MVHLLCKQSVAGSSPVLSTLKESFAVGRSGATKDTPIGPHRTFLARGQGAGTVTRSASDADRFCHRCETSPRVILCGATG